MRVERTRREGRDVVVKHTHHPADLEAEGLAALAAAGAPVPDVVDVGGHDLVLVDLDAVGVGAPSARDWEDLGGRLADVHRVTGEDFGWHRDNVLGTTTQHNTRSPDWAAFHWSCRIAPHLDVLPVPIANRLRAARADLARRLDHGPVPSLLHGDLWSGNVVHGRWFIDPAVSHGDREHDLAFARLFGGIPEAFFRGYDEAWPCDDGWRDRLPVLQLYHLLVHVRQFGHGWVAPVVERLDAAGW